MKTKTRPAGKVGATAEGAYDPDREYQNLESVLYEHDSWVSLDNGNKGHTPQEGSNWWRKQTEGGKHAYECGDIAKQKGETAEQQGNTAQGKGEEAERQGNAAQQKGNAAAAAGAFATLMAQHPPKIGKTLPDGDPDDNYWYYFVPNQELDGGTYVNTGVISKGESLNWSEMTEEEKREVMEGAARMALENLVVIDVEDETIQSWINPTPDPEPEPEPEEEEEPEQENP